MQEEFLALVREQRDADRTGAQIGVGAIGAAVAGTWAFVLGHALLAALGVLLALARGALRRRDIHG